MFKLGIAIFWRRGLRVFACLGLLLAAPAWPAFTWPGCADLTDADFSSRPLVTYAGAGLKEPVKMALDMDAQGNVDIYFVERYGKLRKFDAKTGAVSTLATIDVPNTSNDGLVGIVLDPGFKQNRWLYLFYSWGSDFRLSRFTLAGAQLDMASEVIILKIPSTRGHWHTGGAMEFDAYGDLWLSVGDNWMYEESAPNTNDLRGKILRIHPLPDGSYTVPQGNLFPPGTAKTRPEIYVMGVRNPYTMTIDPVRRWVGWGDVGPDVNSGTTEEHNFTTKPGFFGWPYFSGNNEESLVKGKNPAAPVNNDPKNTGLTTLPPAIPAIDPYPRSAAMTGPYYRYDGALASKIKMPPHFNRKWFVADWKHNWIQAITLDSTGTKKLAMEKVFSNIHVYALTDFKTGPDGAFYVLNYAGNYTSSVNTGIIRIEYKGTCLPPQPTLEPTPVSARPEAAGRTLLARGELVRVDSRGEFTLSVRDLRGRVAEVRRGRGRAEYAFDRLPGPGIYFLEFSGPEGRLSAKLVKR